MPNSVVSQSKASNASRTISKERKLLRIPSEPFQASDRLSGDLSERKWLVVQALG
jgi:hypothetical protein